MATKVVLSSLLFLVLPLMPWSELENTDPYCTYPSADAVCIYCPRSTANYTFGSPFEHNLRNLLKSLASNTSLTGFYQNSTGDQTDTVYAQALCRGDVGRSDCRNCIEKATIELLEKCPTMEANIWSDLCQVHYADMMFFSLLTYAGKFPSYNEGRNGTDLTKHGSVLVDLFGKLSHEAAYNTSRNMFAVGRVKASSKMIYGLVQCTRDVSHDTCYSCLTSALGDLQGCCSSHQGGMVLSDSCYVRFEPYIFYNVSAVDELYLSKSGSSKVREVIMAIGIAATIVIVLASSYLFYRWTRQRNQRGKEKNQSDIISALSIPRGVAMTEEGILVSTEELPFMDLVTIKIATEEFSESRKLGQGGFGVVYEGLLPDDTKIAVKRLSRKSWQGLEEFKNEIILIAKLQHRNLVRLLACAIEGEEKILVYEFMPNKSLDLFIFDPEKRAQLDWSVRYNITNGIARGLLYLHEDSRLRIIHRDLKPNNVLLDHDMAAKIADFGMARIFSEDRNMANTRRVVGTYGYMAPEYAMEGLFSVKSDVFSFGVILLEIISGMKNIRFHLTGHAPTLLAYAWKLWNERKELDLVDSLMPEAYPAAEVTRCIHIALLCVQEDPEDRPTMNQVVPLLSTESATLSEPKSPAVSVGKMINYNEILSIASSVNNITTSTIDPR